LAAWGIEPAIFRLAALCLIQLRHCVLHYYLVGITNYAYSYYASFDIFVLSPS
jgi:hypothetical protein